MTALTINGSAVAATTLIAAGKLFDTTGGTSGSTSTKVGTATGRKQIFAKGTTTSQSGVGSIPAPTDVNFNGWLWDVTTLEGQRLAAGTWTPTIHLLASTGTTITPTVEWYKRSSSGVYTQIGTVTGSSIALTTSSQLLVFTAPSLALMDFATGDKLCMWLWVNQTAGGATNSTISVVEATSGSSAGVASEAQTVTPGYTPAPVALSVTCAGTGVLSPSIYRAAILADSPIRYYRLEESIGTVAADIGSQAQNGTLSGGITLAQPGLLAGDSSTCMLFNGTTGYISLPTTSLPSGAAAWTMEAWIELSALPAAGNYPMVWYFGQQVAGQTAALYYNGDAGQIELGVDSAPDLLGGTLSINTPYHLMGTYDGTTVRFYVNGALKDSKTITLSIVATNLLLGNDTSSHFWTKYIDEGAMYSTALTATQAATHIRASLSPLLLSTTLACTASGVGTLTARGVHILGGIGIFPANNVWNRAIRDLSVHTSSAAWITAIGGTTPLQCKTSTTSGGGGIPYNLVTNATPTYSPTLFYAAETYTGAFPIPASPLYEEPGVGGSDNHLVCLNTDTGILYEMDGYNGGAPGAVTGTAAWAWDMASNTLPAQFSGNDPVTSIASSMALLPGLVTYDEVAAGVISHALYMALPLGAGYGNQIWPAKHNDGSTAGYPPQGARFRLKASVSISGYSAINQVILTALKVYGCFNCDAGTSAQFRLQGVPDSRWNMTDLGNLATVTAADFEVVDESGVMLVTTSGQAIPEFTAVLAATLAGTGTLAATFSLKTALASTLAGVGTASGTLSIITGTTTRSATGRFKSSIRTLKNVAGRTKVSAQHILPVAGRSRVSVASIRNGAGRFRASITTAKNGVGRVRIAIAKHWSGRLLLSIKTSVNAIGRFRSSITTKKTGIGRLRASSKTSPNVTGRLRSSISSVCNATGRFLSSIATTKNGVGRFRLAIAKRWTGRILVSIRITKNAVGRFLSSVRTTKNTVGRFLSSAKTTKNGIGRVRVAIRATKNGLGRFRSSIKTSSNAIGRLRYNITSLCNGIGRYKSSASHTLTGIGRFKSNIKAIRNGVGRFRLAINKSATGRYRSSAKTINSAIGRIKISTGIVTIRSGLGRLRASISASKNGKGRFLLAILITKSSVGRFKSSAKTTKQGAGRFLSSIKTNKNGIGRIRASTSVLKSGVGRYKASILITKQVVGRFFIGIRSSKNGIGRFRASTTVLKSAVGRIRASIVITRSTIGRAYIAIVHKSGVVGRLPLKATAIRSAVGRIRITFGTIIVRTMPGRVRVSASDVRSVAGRINIVIATIDTVYYVANNVSTTQIAPASTTFGIAYNTTVWDI